VLALAPALAKREGALSIPVYLGDAMQLSISQMLGGRELKITVPPPTAGQSAGRQPGAAETLDFPETFCRDPRLFDKAIEAMRSGSHQDWKRKQIEAALVRITEQHFKRDITEEEKAAIQDLGQTYEVFDRLRREGRDTVWAYVARNLSRPLSLSASGGWAHVIVGNPPWVAYRHMSEDLQKRFKQLATVERVLVPRVSSQNDLCALFAVRAAALYLKAAGRLALVMPMAVLTRNQFSAFRTGAFDSTRLAFDEAWKMDETVKPLFPVPSCVIFARKRAVGAPLPATVRSYSGTLPYRDAPEETADAFLRVVEKAPADRPAQHTGGSPYREKFRNGATLFPRMLIFVDRIEHTRLSGDATMPQVVSHRTNQEKQPWKALPSISGTVEREFLRPILLGESVVPFRIFRPFEGVVAVREGKVLDSQQAANRGLSGLSAWLANVESVWESNRRSEKFSFRELNDYFGQLTAQFPISPLRVVYSKAGTLLAAAVVTDPRLVIENSLYWYSPASADEAFYLAAILNSEGVRKRIESLQSKGQWGARHFDKVMFTLGIPLFDDKDALHTRLAAAGREAETLVATVPLADDARFQPARGKVRKALTDAGVSQRIDVMIDDLLDDP
jgi:hypothetical protein